MLSAILGLAAPAIFSSVPALAAIGLPSFAASAIGSGLGALLEGRKGDEALQAAALGGLGGALAGGTSAPIGTTADLATKAAPMTSNISGVAGGIDSAAPGLAAKTLPTTGPFAAPQISANVAPSFTDTLLSAPSLAAGAATGLGMPPMTQNFKKDDSPDPPPGVKPDRLTRKPPEDYRPGKDDEFDYMFPRNFAEGGLASMERDANELNDKELINKAVDAIQNELPNPEEVLGVFLARFGEEALRDLVKRVQDGTFDENVERSEGMVEGAGDGMDDMVPAKLEGEQDVLLSDGEFIVPADVVSGIGNGSSEAGSQRLYDMMDRVRELRTGMTEQPDDIPVEEMMPA